MANYVSEGTELAGCPTAPGCMIPCDGATGGLGLSPSLFTKLLVPANRYDVWAGVHPACRIPSPFDTLCRQLQSQCCRLLTESQSSGSARWMSSSGEIGLTVTYNGGNSWTIETFHASRGSSTMTVTGNPNTASGRWARAACASLGVSGLGAFDMATFGELPLWQKGLIAVGTLGGLYIIAKKTKLLKNGRRRNRRRGSRRGRR